MKWNQYTDQAIRILVYLARSKSPTPSLELANHLKTSQYNVIMHAGPLINDGLIGVKPGVGGGYFLAMASASISLHEVIIKYESPNLFPPLSSPDETTRRISMVYDFLQCATDHIFKSISIEDIAFGDEGTLTKAEKYAMNATIIALANTDIEERTELKMGPESILCSEP